MHSEVYIYRVTCPECGIVSYGFVGANENGNFYCDAKIEIKKGNKTTTEECGYSSEKIWHMPDDSYEKVKTIKIEDFGFTR
jgi:hypothetical protein